MNEKKDFCRIKLLRKFLPTSLVDEALTGSMYGEEIDIENAGFIELLFWISEVNRKFKSLTEPKQQ